MSRRDVTRDVTRDKPPSPCMRCDCHTYMFDGDRPPIYGGAGLPSACRCGHAVYHHAVPGNRS